MILFLNFLFFANLDFNFSTILLNNANMNRCLSFTDSKIRILNLQAYTAQKTVSANPTNAYNLSERPLISRLSTIVPYRWSFKSHFRIHAFVGGIFQFYSSIKLYLWSYLLFDILLKSHATIKTLGILV